MNVLPPIEHDSPPQNEAEARPDMNVLPPIEHDSPPQNEAEARPDMNVLPPNERDKVFRHHRDPRSTQLWIEAQRQNEREARPDMNVLPPIDYDMPDGPNILDSINRVNQTKINASLQGVTSIFDERMYRAIRHVPVNENGTVVLKAAITMGFPEDLVDCVMMLDICEEEVEHLLKDLFRCDKILLMGLLHLKQNDVKITTNMSNPEFNLKGVRDQTIYDVFGGEILRAITESKMRKKELKEQGDCATDCVSMIIPKKGAYINLCLDLKGGVEIKDKLYT